MVTTLRRRFLFLFCLLFCSLYLYAQDTIQFSVPSKKQMQAVRISCPIIIDGLLNDSCWNTIPFAEGFIQYDPYNGHASNDTTYVKLAYNNDALYIGAYLRTKGLPVLTALGSRDSWGSKSDKFGIWLMPFNDGINGFEFWVTAAGAQIDAKRTLDRSDTNWDEVWQSMVSVTDSGWYIEMLIPYAALRFPKLPVQSWGLNFWRINSRTGESSTWNYINREVAGVFSQSGELTELLNIVPPLRLSFTPYVTGYVQDTPGSSTSYTYKGGLDLKYGINESFTLDVMLIPDFGQTEADYKVLNLSPFETKYSEKRAFFMEGSELFGKADLFYSKRIGAQPRNYDNVASMLLPGEEIIQNPQTTNLINTTKLSGRTAGGLGVGFLNAMTNDAFATVVDTLTGNKRTILTQPFTNYNVFVLDQNLKNNSYFSIINTNMLLNGFMANATGTDFSLSNRKNSYRISGKAATSYQSDSVNDILGFLYNIGVDKINGKFRWGLSRSVLDNHYDINDMGYIRKNNQTNNNLFFRYNNYVQTKRFLKQTYSIAFNHLSQYEPRKFSEFVIGLNTFHQFHNYASFRANLSVKPVEENNFDASRVAGRAFIEPESATLSISYGSDDRKKYVVWFSLGGWSVNGLGQKSLWSYIGQSYSLGAKASLGYDLGYSRGYDIFNYATKNDANDSIIFGSMDQINIENAITANYTFNTSSTISLRVRHYWSEVKYDRYFLLAESGRLNAFTDYTGYHDINYNAFNIDMVYSWRFAPGSEMNLVWKNEISVWGDNPTMFYNGYFNNLSKTIVGEQLNSISLRILYYIDYHQLKRTISRKAV